MATTQELHTLRTLALDEQFTSAVEQRSPDRNLLDSLGKLVLPDFSLVMCQSEQAYRQDFDEKSETGYVITPIDQPITVLGRFGGFFSGAVESVFDDEIITVEKVSYFVMTDDFKDTGFLFPVEVSKIMDALVELKDDPVFEDLTYELGQEKIDIKKIADIICNGVYGPNIKPYYSSYIQLTLKPSELFSWVQAKSCLPIGFNDAFVEKSMHTYNVGIPITQDHCFSIMQLDEGPTCLTIMDGSIPSLVIPVRAINGCVATDLLQIEW